MAKPTPAQWIQICIDVILAIGTALLAVFK